MVSMDQRKWLVGFEPSHFPGRDSYIYFSFIPLQPRSGISEGIFTCQWQTSKYANILIQLASIVDNVEHQRTLVGTNSHHNMKRNKSFQLWELTGCNLNEKKQPLVINLYVGLTSRASLLFWVRVPSLSHKSQMLWQRWFTAATSW